MVELAVTLALCYTMRMPVYKYTKELLEPIVKESKSVMEVMRKLGVRMSGGTHAHISRRIKTLELDTSHFLGKGANCGSNKKGGPQKKHWEERLVKRDSGARAKANKLRQALIESGLKEVCSSCPTDTIWQSKPLVLQIDHINGDWLDDRKENLRFLCPNCHSQTNNWCKKKAG